MRRDVDARGTNASRSCGSTCSDAATFQLVLSGQLERLALTDQTTRRAPSKVAPYHDDEIASTRTRAPVCGACTKRPSPM
jgi:hypothetical protein